MKVIVLLLAILFNIIFLPIAWTLFALGFATYEIWSNFMYGFNKSRAGYLLEKAKILREKYGS